jgi:hypothetical protein
MSYKYKYGKYKTKYLELKKTQTGGTEIYEPVEPRVFTFWTGTNPITKNRIAALDNIRATVGVPVILITQNNLKEWIKENYPLHPAYNYLSSVHKADYLRCYFMYHYGGGYTDIKFQTGSWTESFNKLNNSPTSIAIGYKEINGGVAQVHDQKLYEEMRKVYYKLIGNCAYIFRRNTFFTKEWYNQTHKKLDEKFEELKKNPAKSHRDSKGSLINNVFSKYPLEWSEILGRIFHPLVYKYNDQILQGLPTPIFKKYQ